MAINITLNNKLIHIKPFKTGLKILWAAMFVRVQVPPRVRGSADAGPFFISTGRT